MDFWNLVKSCPLFSLLETRGSMVDSFATNLLLLPSWFPFLVLRLFLLLLLGLPADDGGICGVPSDAGAGVGAGVPPEVLMAACGRS